MAIIRRTSRAKADLLDILVYLGDHSPKAAEQFAQAVSENCQRLAQFPEMGRSREELASGVRSFPVGKYLLFYRPIEHGIELVRALHGARDLPSQFRQ